MKVALFAAISSSPFVAAALLFKSLLREKQQQQESAAHAAADAESALKAAQEIVAASPVCICIAGSSKGGRVCSTAVDPHLPESRVLRLPSAEVVKGVANNALTNLLAGQRSSFSLPFNFVHFALGAASELLARLSAGEPLSLLYIDRSTGDSVLLTGIAAVVEAPAYRSHYWRASWGFSLPGGPASADYKLIKFVPSAISVDLAARGPSRWAPITLTRVIAEDSISWELHGGGTAPVKSSS